MEKENIQITIDDTVIEFLNNKKEIFKNANIEELINLLEENTNKTALKDLLSPFVDPSVEREKSDNIKYGQKTKERYCKAIKGELPRFYSDPKHKKAISAETNAFIRFPKIFADWCCSNIELTPIIKTLPKDKSVIKLDFQQLLNAAIDSKKVSKETLMTFYKFAPIPINKNIENKIKKAPGRLYIIEQLRIEQQKLQEKYSDYDELKKIKNDKEQIENDAYAFITKNDEIEQKLKNEEQENKQLQEKISILEEKNNELESENQEWNQKYNDLLTESQQWEQDYNELLNENDILEKNKKSLGSIDKMKENFRNQIQEKDEKIKELTDKLSSTEEIIEKYDSLIAENATLKRREINILKDLKSNILQDIDFRKNLKRIILNDKDTCNLIIRNLNLKAEIVMQAANIKSSKMIEKEMEESKQKQQAEKIQIKSEEFIPETMIYDAELITPLREGTFDNSKEEAFKDELFMRLQGNKEYQEDFYQKIKKSFVILNTEDEFKQYKRAIREVYDYDLQTKEVIPDFEWISYKDWFGYYQNGKFHPAITLIADYYKQLKDNQNIPLGIIVFKDFNRIMPEFYLEQFVNELENNGKIYLVHPLEDVEDKYFKMIECIPNIKFVFIKTKDIRAFDIPETMKKYEVMSMNFEE